MLDTIAQILMYAMFATPFICVPLVLKMFEHEKGEKRTLGGFIVTIFIGLVFAVILSFILFNISWAITFRNGMGPG